MNAALATHVYLVGAGPGQLEHLTLRAHALITSASCILHDDLVSAEVLSLAPSASVIRNVGKRCGQKTITQQQINDWMVHYAREGHSVVRLKSGDPLLFGRAVEEIEAMVAASIPFEIVPGISTGFAAAALAGIPLTGRVTNSRVLFATRHLAAGTNSAITPAITNGLAGITPDVTLVLYMPGRDYAAIASELTANGWSPETVCVLASTLGAATQQFAQCRLSNLQQMEVMPTPALMLFFPKA
jgi:uroporphyrin-III C-methyltransferase